MRAALRAIWISMMVGLSSTAAPASAQEYANWELPQPTQHVAPAGNTQDILTFEDRLRIASRRTRSLVHDWGSGSLTLSGIRFRSVRPTHQEMPAREDNFVVYELNGEARLDIDSSVSLLASGTVGLMNRRLGLVEIDPRRSQTVMAISGLTIQFSGGDSVGLHFVEIRPASARSAHRRMAELVGGAPRTGRGFRITAFRRLEISRSTLVELGLAASVQGGSGRDPTFPGASFNAPDRRVAFELRAAF